MPPPPPSDWARMPTALSPLVVRWPDELTVTLRPLPPPPPDPPIEKRPPLEPPSPPPPPIDSAWMAVPTVVMRPVLLTVTVPPLLVALPEPPMATAPPLSPPLPPPPPIDWAKMRARLRADRDQRAVIVDGDGAADPAGRAIAANCNQAAAVGARAAAATDRLCHDRVRADVMGIGIGAAIGNDGGSRRIVDDDGAAIATSRARAADRDQPADIAAAPPPPPIDCAKMP